MQDDKPTFEQIVGGPELDGLRQLDEETKDPNSFGGLDAYGNDLTLLYHASVCEKHGKEVALAVVVNDQGAMFPITQAPLLVGWLNEKIAQARQDGLLD